MIYLTEFTENLLRNLTSWELQEILSEETTDYFNLQICDINEDVEKNIVFLGCN
jgi:hypothetical protein